MARFFMFFFKKKKIDIIIYMVPGCHLCDDAISLIGSFASEYLLDIKVVDILSDRSLLERYQYDVPVVFANGNELFRHKIEKKKLAGLLKKIK